MNIDDIANHLEAKRKGNYYFSKCPAHPDKHPSLIFFEKEGKLYFNCKAGCDFRHVRQALGLSGGTSFDPGPPAERDYLAEAVKRRKIVNAWDNGLPITEGSPVWHYLVNNRKLLSPGEAVPSVLRYADSLRYYDHDGNHLGDFPAMLARMDRPDGSIATIHRTYLTAEGQKAPVPQVKKLMPSIEGTLEGTAIRLLDSVNIKEIGVTLGIAEGIETALACFKLFDIPTWAAWSAAGLAHFVVPDNIQNLVIFADKDKAGIEFANRLLERLNKERPDLKVRMKLPKVFGTDFADEYIQDIRV